MSTSKNPIDVIIDELYQWDKDGKFLAQLELKIRTILRDVLVRASDNYNDSYCMTFNIPNTKIQSLLDDLPFTNQSQLLYAMVKGWEQEPGVGKMREHPFYITLIYIAIYALRRLSNKYKPEDNPIVKDIQLLIMFRLWNGQRQRYIPICQPEVVKYVVSEKMNKNYLAHKYETPLQLLKKNYIDGEISSRGVARPTIPKTYFPKIAKDSKESIQMIDAPYKRIRQLFVSTRAVNLIKNNATYTSGIASLYHEASRNNERINTAKVQQGDDDNASDITSGFSSSSYDNLVETVVNYITMNSNPFYDKDFHVFLDEELKKMKPDMKNKMLKAIHKVEYDSYLTDLLENILARLSGTNKSDFCSPLFFKGVVKRKIVSSKHNPEVNKIKTAATAMINDVFITNFDDNRFMGWSDTQKSLFINLVVYAICYNLRRKICFE